ncbi:MAG: thioredoxin domain-containing protein [Planctomycetes bacterium]|nr:thioredoxin domain-containing protein [Planctomycetota bacterium]
MFRSTILPIAVVVLSLVAARISTALLDKHITGSSGATWFDAGCSDDAAAGAPDCAAVLASPYSYFPAKFPTRHADRYKPDGRPHVPVALLGLVYYSVLGVWFIGVGRPSPQLRWLHLAPCLFIAAGLGGSGYYTYIMFTVLTEWCSWCVVTHVLNLLIGCCVVIMIPSRAVPHPEPRASARAVPQPVGSDKTVPDAVVVTPPTQDADRTFHPSTRLVVLTLLAAAFISYAHLARLGSKQWKKQAEVYLTTLGQYKAAIDRIKGDTAQLARLWEMGETHDIHIRPDDAIRTQASPGEPTWSVVIFSDFECPSCKRVATILEEQAQPLFAGRLAIVFKHYPLHTDCNARTTTKMHKHACHAATIAEAARILGGSDGFWRAHDFLFANQHRLKNGQLSAETVATELGLDPTAFQEAMESDAPAQRIREDVDEGAKRNLRSTPAVFVQGRKVDGLAARELGFWDELADRYWQSIGEPRPESTRPPDAAPTLDTRDPTNAP